MYPHRLAAQRARQTSIRNTKGAEAILLLFDSKGMRTKGREHGHADSGKEAEEERDKIKVRGEQSMGMARKRSAARGGVSTAGKEEKREESRIPVG